MLRMMKPWFSDEEDSVANKDVQDRRLQACTWRIQSQKSFYATSEGEDENKIINY
jgi:hypothetical protein